MAVTEKQSNIIVSVDPGFDSVKVCLNGGVLIKIPKEVADITGKSNLFLGPKEASYIKVKYAEGKEHLVGVYAAQYLNEASYDANKGVEEKASIADTFATFETFDKQVLIMSSIGAALITLAKMNSTVVFLNKKGEREFEVNTSQAKLHFGVSLPHDAVDSEWGYINSWLSQAHKFDIELEDGIYHLDIKPESTKKASQVVVALVGAITDDDGNVTKNELLNPEQLPALVIDGGMLTLGKFLFTSVKSVDGGESNQTYAMKNVYERVAEIIREDYRRTDITYRKIKRIMEEGCKIPYLKEDGSSGIIEVDKLVNEELEKVCRIMIDELYEEYNDLFDVKTILITGGTGAAYYKIFNAILKKERPWISVLLTDYEFFGEKISPEFAISVGMYKALFNAISR